MNQIFSQFHNCPNHMISKGRLIIDEIRGEIFCQKCGFVMKEKINTADNEKIVLSQSIGQQFVEENK